MTDHAAEFSLAKATMVSLIEEAAEMRQRCWTLLVRGYDEARCAIHFLRWKENDADAIAPSLYGGHRLRLVSTD